jgi:hypothetical protein
MNQAPILFRLMAIKQLSNRFFCQRMLYISETIIKKFAKKNKLSEDPFLAV